MNQNLPKLSKDSMSPIAVPHASGQSSPREWLSQCSSRLWRTWFDLPIAAFTIWFAVMTFFAYRYQALVRRLLLRRATSPPRVRNCECATYIDVFAHHAHPRQHGRTPAKRC
jgi:hypothetical protein